jgi:hypothetical protein
MTDGDQSISKHASPIPGYLSEMMSVGRMVEVLEGLQFNKREEGRLVVDPGITNFLIRAAKAAAADHLDMKVRHVWRSIRPPR